jgi:streptogramin lyase
MRLILLSLSVLAGAAPAPPVVRATSLPSTAIVGTPWQVAVRAAKAPTIVASGPSTLRAKAAGKAGVFRARLTFPRAGAWRISAVLGGKTTRLGTVAVDVPRDPLLTNPFTVAVEPLGSLLVGQLDGGPLVRFAGGRATALSSERSVIDVAVSPSGVAYAVANDGITYRLDGTSLVAVTPPLDTTSVAIDAAGNLYCAVYAGWVKKVTPAGAVTTIAGNGTEGYSGDGGPATSAQLFHPHGIAVGPDGAVYVADTENRRIRRLDPATGAISTLGGDVGIVVSVAVASDGMVYGADLVRGGVGGGVTRTTAHGVTTRLSTVEANGVAVGASGAVYVNQWEAKRIQRLDPGTGTLEPIARG